MFMARRGAAFTCVAGPEHQACEPFTLLTHAAAPPGALSGCEAGANALSSAVCKAL